MRPGCKASDQKDCLQNKDSMLDNKNPMIIAAICACIIGFSGIGNTGVSASPSYLDPFRILVVYKTNSADRDMDGIGDSEQLAAYYGLKRAVPQDNLLGLTVSVPYYYYYTNEYAKFYKEIAEPIKIKLQSLGANNIDTILMAGDLPTIVYDGSSNVRS